jgi:hypothetical protein
VKVTVIARSAADPTKTATALVSFYSPSVSGDFPLLGSFLNFYRDMPQALWAKEFGWMNGVSVNSIIVDALGSLKPDSSDPTGYSLSAEGLLYPSMLVDPADRPTTDRLEMILSLADTYAMKVYLGSLQTYADWTTGQEFNALSKYNLLVAQEIVANYGHHPSLAGWYFTQEIWMNWIKFYQSNWGLGIGCAWMDYTGNTYYGTTLLANYVADMKAVDPTKPVSAAIVFKETARGCMPSMSASEVQSYTTSFLQASGLEILAPQDGQGAGNGAPPLSDLPSYFQAFANAVAAAGPQTVLWSTVETFSSIANYGPAQYPPGDALRIQQQVNAVRPYVTGYVSYIYGDDMSQQATFWPVEASALSRSYQSRSRPSTVPDTPHLDIASYQSSPPPYSSYADPTGRHLADHTGGGYDEYNLSDWSAIPSTTTAELSCSLRT